MIKINLKIKSFEKYYINITLNEIFKILKFFSIDKYSIISLPKKIKKFTVIRSPHIDKKSREQYEIRTYKTIIKVRISNNAIALLFLEVLKNFKFIGIQLEITLQTKSYTIFLYIYNYHL